MTIYIGGRNLTTEDFRQIVFHHAPVALDEQALETVRENFDFLEEFSKNKIIYGINTGLGPMSQYKVQEKDRLALQYNLIRSHAAGTGKPIEDVHVKALLIARLNMLMKGYSGIHPSAVILLKDFINHDIFYHPKVIFGTPASFSKVKFLYNHIDGYRSEG